MSAKERTKRYSRVCLALVILMPFVWFFGRAILHAEVFAFRDAANFYLPLFEWQCEEWKTGRVPLWNPHDNCGMPALADTSSSVLYPGKLLFALPIDFVRRFNLYVTLHVLLAAGTAYLLARRLRASPEAAGICAVSYAYGGSVLFQYANVIYLVGAAWLPLAVLATDRMLRQRSWRWAVGLGAVLALMILGGDPQTAYHAVLLAGLYAMLAWRRGRRTRGVAKPCVPGVPARRASWLVRGVRGRAIRRTSPADKQTGHADESANYELVVSLTRRRLVLLLVAVVAACVLSAVQLLPAMEWTHESDRAAFHAPRNVYEVASNANDLMKGRRTTFPWREGLFGRPQRGTHHEHIYRFSVGPWRLVELIWPNCTGRIFPTNRRWISLLPAEGQTWTPSLYLGLLPFCLALMGWRIRSGTLPTRWFSWAALLALLGSFGWYGVGWLLHEFRAGILGDRTGEMLIGQPVGGLYWLMVVVLPGFAYFRYPAKLLVVASLGLSVLAARGWDELWDGKSWALSRLLAWLAALSITGALIAAMALPTWEASLTDPPVDDVFGPLDVRGAAKDVRHALLHAFIVSSLMWFVLRQRARCARSLLGYVALLVTVLDLMVAHSWTTPTIARRVLNDAPEVVREIESHSLSPSAGGPFRAFRASSRGWRPASWSQGSSTSRLSAVARWEHATLLPKYHLRWHVSLVESPSSLQSQRHRAFLHIAREQGVRRVDGNLEPHPAVLRALSTRWCLGPPGTFPASFEDGRDLQPAGLEDTMVWKNSGSFPRAWIVHQVQALPPLLARDPEELERRTREVLFPDGSARDLRRVAVVEGDVKPQPVVGVPASAGLFPPEGGTPADISNRLRHDLSLLEESPDDTDICRVVDCDSQQVEIEAELGSPGLLVLNDLFYPGWVADTIAADGSTKMRLPILRTNCLMRGIRLPAGRHRVMLRYRPFRFFLGSAISCLGWGLLMLVVARSRRTATCLGASY